MGKAGKAGKKPLKNKSDVKSDFKKITSVMAKNSTRDGGLMVENTKPQWMSKEPRVRRQPTLAGAYFVPHKEMFRFKKTFELKGDPSMGFTSPFYFDMDSDMNVYGNPNDPSKDIDESVTQLESGRIDVDRIELSREPVKPLDEQVKDDEAIGTSKENGS